MSFRRGKMSVPMVVREQKLHEKDIDESLLVSSLQHTRSKVMDKIDFTDEVRGTRDIAIFLEKSVVGRIKSSTIKRFL